LSGSYENLINLENAANTSWIEPKEIKKLLTPPVTDCADIKKINPGSTSGVYDLATQPGDSQFEVYCDMETTGGGWTIFQRRMDGSENFTRTWGDYAKGFGNPAKEFWLGNDRLSLLTSARKYKLRIDLGDWEGNLRYAEYSLFQLADSCDKYRLSTLGTYIGNAGNSLYYHKVLKFSTYDQDNDGSVDNCAVRYRGAWWYDECHRANLNAEYNNTEYGEGVNWFTWVGVPDSLTYSLRLSEMKIRPVTY